MIKVVDMGFQFVNVGGYEANFPEGSGDYLFLYLRCPTEVNLTGEYKLLPACTYLIYRKDSPQLYRKWDAHFINDWIHFDFDRYDSYFEKLGIPLDTPLTLPSNYEIMLMTSDLLLEYFSSDADRETILAQKADTLFRKFSELYHFSLSHSLKMNDYLNRFTQLRGQITSRQLCPSSIQELADSMNLSLSYFQHLYKDFFGCSVNNDIVRARLDQAAHLLTHTDYSVSEISVLCGYENFEHFSRLFKKYKGASPRRYRSLNR